MPYVFNPLTGNFDAVRKASLTEEEIREMILQTINNIATTKYNALGNLMYVFDPVSCKYVEMAAIPVTDEDGNIVVAEPEDTP